ncbi:MAG: DNA alkylation repair protein [Clostridiales bacterium]|nr:DNA alkylation repair protein [Clostridiales bacterium]
MLESYEQVKAAINAEANAKYDAFNNPIVNSTYRTIGVRIPVMRKIVKATDINKRDGILNDFFVDGDKTFETVLYAGMLASRKGDYGKTREYLKKIIPLFGSWAHVDCVMSCLDWVDRELFASDFRYLLTCDGEYEKRTYLIYMFNFVDDDGIERVFETLQSVEYGQYYVDMGAAWLIAECLTKCYEMTLPLIESKTLPKFVHNKAIQKARESYRITDERKASLNTLKVK